MNEHTASGHAKSASVSAPSSHSPDRFTSTAAKRLHQVSSGCGQFLKKKNCFRHRARVGNCHRRDVQPMCATQPTCTHFMRHSCCVIQRIRCVSRPLPSNICTVVFCAIHSRELLRLFCVHMGAAVWCPQYLVRITLKIKCANIFSTQAKNFTKSPFSSRKTRHPRQIP